MDDLKKIEWYDFDRFEFRAIDWLEASIDFVEFDLQRFAAEDEGRTEDPTERRKREEREKGNVPKSQDLPGALVMLGGTVMLFLFAGFMLDRIFQMFRLYLTRISSIGTSFGQEEVYIILKDFFYQTGMIIFPVLSFALILGVVGNLIQVGFLFTLQPLEFKLERLIPDFKRVLPVRRNFVNLLKVLSQVVAIGLLAYFVVIDDIIPMLQTSGMELRGVISIFGSIA
ncbi:MAG: EscU/YscU/HrcU family type III secretion system export apparatus switch protein, partial [Leptonema sp. (in: Bacteria)]|nr:EscU/YscU/HrcU family type III secretion system export apparatus switch protein [Leptonema sp. (in: bacteria)]